MSVKTIFLDMDGVIVDFQGPALEMFGVSRWHVGEIDAWDAMPRVVSKHIGCQISDADFWETIEKGDSDFWANLPWTEMGHAVYALCAHTAPTICMSTPTLDPNSAKGKLEWLNAQNDTMYKLAVGAPDRHFPKPPCRMYSLTPVKGMFPVPGSVLIDDSPANVKAFQEKGGRAYLFPAPWNDPNWRDRDVLTELKDFLSWEGPTA